MLETALRATELFCLFSRSNSSCQSSPLRGYLCSFIFFLYSFFFFVSFLVVSVSSLFLRNLSRPHTMACHAGCCACALAPPAVFRQIFNERYDDDLNWSLMEDSVWRRAEKIEGRTKKKHLHHTALREKHQIRSATISRRCRKLRTCRLVGSASQVRPCVTYVPVTVPEEISNTRRF